MTTTALTKVRASQINAGMTIEFHGVRPCYLDSQVGPAWSAEEGLRWEQVPAKTPLLVTWVEVRYNTSQGVGGMSKSGNREYLVTFRGGRQAVLSNQQKVVVK